jgi:hypothetical protein
MPISLLYQAEVDAKLLHVAFSTAEEFWKVIMRGICCGW